MSGILKIVKNFECSEFVTYIRRGRVFWIARDIGRLMGYSDGEEYFTKSIRHDRKSGFVDGGDYVLISGCELDEFKREFGLAADDGFVNLHNLMLLSESGLHFALTKTTKTVGLRLRRFIVEEIMPQVLCELSYPGTDIEMCQTVESDWQSPLDISQRYGSSLQMVLRVVTRLHLRANKEGLCREIIIEDDELGYTLTNYLYSPKAVELIRQELERCDAVSDCLNEREHSMTILRKDYDELMRDSQILETLMEYGVESWGGYRPAMKQFREDKRFGYYEAGYEAGQIAAREEFERGCKKAKEG